MFFQMDGTVDTGTEQMPRIGSDYQADLPNLLSKFDYINLTDKRSYLENSKTSSYHAATADYNSWTVIEEDIFLLALYIFGRDFLLVKQFIGGSKSMEDVLSHFYATFYGSERYHKWSECKKGKGRKYAHGVKIFTGLRQKELLSRLTPLFTKEHNTKLINEVSKSLEECKISLKEYVFTLKDMVGVTNLIEAIGIGKGKKHDLTCTPIHHPKLISPLLQKSYSELSAAEIVNLMQSGARLSKAKSIDLFWEAIWPRLLANGWHSEESMKDCLVFLIPEVGKFSRGFGLVKGRHYFDSVPAVMSKVSSEPQLLHIESSSDAMKSEEERYLSFNMSETDIFKPVKECYSQVELHFDELVVPEGQVGIRQSGRKRRLTTRALESLALSYIGMHTNKRIKSVI